MRVACITPYYRESREVLERCLQSVARQTMPCTHYLISDGHPQDWIDDLPVRHLRLGENHADSGDTPRGVGGLLAASEGAEAVFYLDADNELEPNHIGACLAAGKGADYVVTQRTLWVEGQQHINFKEEPGHVDTNCLFLMRPAFTLLALWALIPRPIALLQDRIFYAALLEKRLRVARTGRATVRYHSFWAIHYERMGLPAPHTAKPTMLLKEETSWWRNLPINEREVVRRLIGLPGFKL